MNPRRGVSSAPFPIGEVALRGFRLAREQPRLLAGLAAFGVVVAAPAGLALDVAFAAALPRDLTMQSLMTPADPARYESLMQALAPLWALGFLYDLVVFAIVGAAVIRAVQRPGENALGYLRLGLDEARQFALAVALAGIAFCAYLACMVPAMAVVVLAGGGGGALAAGGAVAAAFGFAIFVAAALAVRLSLSPPATFAGGRLRLGASWTATQGIGWRLFAAYLLAGLMILVVYFLGYSIILAVTAIIGGGPQALGAALSPHGAAIVTPVRAAYVILSGLLQALIWPVAFAPPAAAAQILRADRG